MINADKPFTSTNLVPRISVSKIILEGGKLADPVKDVVIKKAEVPLTKPKD